MTANDEKESPLRRPPLRQAGQSLQEQMDRVWDEKIDFYLLTALVVGALAFWDWWFWFFKIPRLPWITTVIAIGYIAFAAIRLRPLYKRYCQLKLGRDGERTVGQELEKLRAHGYRVYHDFLADGFNIDHIVIGPTGVFTINTKAVSKPKDPNAKIEYDGTRVTIPGTKLDRDPIAQAKAERDFIRKWIRENANRDAPVRPAVVFVGWYTARRPEGAEVWVLNVSGLLSFIQNEHSELSEDDIVHICGILEAHILKKQRDLYDKLSPSWIN
ncbi:MAG: nuclease-related domain-containing protein [Verrucomicrobiia bacterium]